MIPQRITPAANTINWSFGSNLSSIVYFDVKIYEASSSGLIAALKYHTTPDKPNGATVDISGILKSYVQPEFKDYTNNLVDTFTKPVFKYYLTITERYLSGNNILVGATFTSSVYTIFHAELDRVSFRYYRAPEYLVAAGKTINFMTTKPNKGYVNFYSDEGLYFLNESFPSLRASYRFYDKAGTEIFSHDTLVTASTKLLHRINCSPSFLASELGVEFENVSSYRVFLSDNTGTILSEVRVFNFVELNCNQIPVNIYWQNKYGGIDTYQFINPIQDLQVSKVSVKKNPYRKTFIGSIVDTDNNVFNAVEEIINSNGTVNMTVNTKQLSDKESTWLSSILTSKRIWMRAQMDFYIPLTLVESSYQASQRKYLDTPNTKKFTFKLSEGMDIDFRATPINTTPAVIAGAEADFYVA